MAEWDSTCDDCTLSHYQLKKLLEMDTQTNEILWDLIVAEKKHIFLIGLYIAEALFIVDIGLLKEARHLPRISSNIITPTIGQQYPDPPKYNVYLTKEGIAYRIQDDQILGCLLTLLPKIRRRGIPRGSLPPRTHSSILLPHSGNKNFINS